MNVQRNFTYADQARFAELSGDANPLHLDAAWAAGHYPGALVVHGMHVLLWALDALGVQEPIRRLSASFIKPVLLDETVLAERDENRVTVSLEGEPILQARLDDAETHPFVSARAGAAGSEHPFADRQGTVSLPDQSQAVATAFPRLCAAIGPQALAGLLGLSALVGMHCPGVGGVFSGFSVRLTGAPGSLAYTVTGFDRRFGRLVMNVAGCGLEGSVTAAVSQPSVEPQPDTELYSLVRPGEFAGQQPLVVGASNGLGAATALLLAAGGARPVLTTHQSLADLQSLERRIIALGGEADLVQCDVRTPAALLGSLAQHGWRGQQVYYFASPRIFRRRLHSYQPEDFHAFVALYVDAFHGIMRAVLRQFPDRAFKVFYPSTTAADTFPADMLEYALAKFAGEQVCKRLTERHERLDIVALRLPRIHTRQTQSFVKVPAAWPHAVMLPIIRNMQAGRPPA